MASSGTITGSTNNSHYTLTCEWSSTQNSSANTSTITANVYLNGNGYNTVSSYWCCTINGTEVTTNWSGKVSGKTKLGSRTWTVNHNSNGSCSTTISFSFSNRVTAGTYTVSSGSGSSSITLPTIPRTSSFSLNKTSGTLPCNFTVTINKASSSFTHTVTYKIGNNSYTKANKTSSSTVTVDCSIGDCNNITTSTSGTGTIIVDTYNGSTKIGSTSKTITLYVPSSVVPSVGISVTANNTGANGEYLANQTTFTCKATNASSQYGATIKSYQWSGGFLTATTATATTGTLGAGDYTLTVKVTDSRGRTARASKKVTLIGIEAPQLTKIKAYRCDSSYNIDGSGTYAKVLINYTIDSTNSNAKQYKVNRRTKGTSSWTSLYDWTNFTNYSATNFVIQLDDGWQINKSYEVQVMIRDSYAYKNLITTITTQSALLNLEKGGVGVGKIWERGVLDIGGDAYSTGSLMLDGSLRVGAGKYIYGTGNDGNNVTLAFVNQSNNASEFGTSTLHTTIKSGDNPTWYTGTDAKSYSIWTDKNCSMSSNGNCQTWRFPNGVQVSIMKVYGTWNITTAWGSVYSSPFISGQSFDKAFLEVPRVIINAHGGGTAIMVCQAGAPTTTATGSIYLWKPTQQTGVKNYIEYIAIGRWK